MKELNRTKGSVFKILSRYGWIVMSFLVIANSCEDNNSTYSFLQQLEPYIAEQSDSVLNALERMNPDEISKAKVKAKYCLMYSIALDKNYIDVSEDSIINIAVHWYKRHGNADEKLKAYYYQGRVYQNAGRWDDAMESYFMAEKFIDDAKDNTQIGLLFSAKAAVYECLYRFDDAILNLHSAAERFLSEQDTARYVNSLISICSEYISTGQSANAEKILSDIETFRPFLSTAQANDYYMLRMQLAISETNEVEKYISDYLKNITDSSDINWLALADGYMNIGKYDAGLKALSYHQVYDPEYDGNPAYHLVNSQLNELTGRYENAIESYRKYTQVSQVI